MADCAITLEKFEEFCRTAFRLPVSDVTVFSSIGVCKVRAADIRRQQKLVDVANNALSRKSHG